MTRVGDWPKRSCWNEMPRWARLGRFGPSADTSIGKHTLKYGANDELKRLFVCELRHITKDESHLSSLSASSSPLSSPVSLFGRGLLCVSQRREALTRAMHLLCGPRTRSLAHKWEPNVADFRMLRLVSLIRTQPRGGEAWAQDKETTCVHFDSRSWIGRHSADANGRRKMRLLDRHYAFVLRQKRDVVAVNNGIHLNWWAHSTLEDPRQTANKS